MFEVAEAMSHKWTGKEARSSGRTAYRIGVELRDNPFKGQVFDDEWTQGYNDAAASDTTSQRKRVDYMAEERHDKRRSYTDGSRSKSKGFVKPGGRGRFVNKDERR